MTKATTADITRICGLHHGVIACWQAEAVGLTPKHLSNRVNAGVLERVEHATYRLVGAPHTWYQDVAVAVLSCGPDAAASHGTAALLQGMTDRRPPRIEVSTKRGRIRSRKFVVHHCRDLDHAAVRIVSGLRTTKPERVVIDLAGTAGLGPAAQVFDTALRQELIEASDVGREVERVARSGRRGIRLSRLLVAERMQWQGRSESELEDRFRRLLGVAGLPDPIAQHVIRDKAGRFLARVDFAWPDRHIVAELDGWAYHRGVDEFRSDRRRQNAIVGAGWIVLRFTWWDVDIMPTEVIRTLRANFWARSS